MRKIKSPKSKIQTEVSSVKERKKTLKDLQEKLWKFLNEKEQTPGSTGNLGLKYPYFNPSESLTDFKQPVLQMYLNLPEKRGVYYHFEISNKEGKRRNNTWYTKDIYRKAIEIIEEIELRRKKRKNGSS